MNEPSEENTHLMDSKNRFVVLDLFRGLAAFSILIFHTYPHKQFSSLYAGVDFFFVLSGYVLLPSIERVTNCKEAGSFIRSRAVRLLPMAAVTIIFVIIIQKIVDIKHFIFGEQNHEGIAIDPQTLLIAFLLLQVFSEKAQWLNMPLWSLSVEWISNIILALYSSAQNFRYILPLILGFALQLHSLFGGETWELQLGRGLFAFTIGAVTRKYLYGDWKASHFKTVLSFVVFIGLHLLLIFWDSNVIFVAPFVFAFLILNASRFNITSDKFVQISKFFGGYSYGFYAWHVPLLSLNSIVIKRILSQAPLIDGWTVHIVFLATIATSLMMTFLVVRFIEPKVRQLFLPH